MDTFDLSFLNNAFTLDNSFWVGLLETIPMGVVIVDTQGKIIYVNELQARIDGLERSELIGKYEYDVYGPYTGPGIIQSCNHTNTPLLGYACQYRVRNGRLVNSAHWVYPLRKEGKVVASVCLQFKLGNEFSFLQNAKFLSAADVLSMLEGKYTRIDTNKSSREDSEKSVIIGDNADFRRMLSMAETTASSPSPVMIAGETGSGKEMVVQAIRNAGNRSGKPYVAINCSAIPFNLLEGILFGSTRGSFTGAVDRPGLFEEADGGTIYLDEIDSMPLELQPKLLRVLQDMRVRRLGASIERKLDVKVISSIANTPEKVLEEKKLRSDLYYRLAVITLRIPPLRERIGDLPALVEHFIQKYNVILKKQVKGVEPAVQDLLQLQDWPGNVRELEHVIAGAMNVTAWEEMLRIHHIPEYHRRNMRNTVNYDGRQSNLPQEQEKTTPTDQIATFLQSFASHGTTPQGQAILASLLSLSTSVPGECSPDCTESVSLTEKLSSDENSLNFLQLAPFVSPEEEAKTLQRALINTRGKSAKAARLLGISRQLFKYKLTKHGINPIDCVRKSLEQQGISKITSWGE